MADECVGCMVIPRRRIDGSAALLDHEHHSVVRVSEVTQLKPAVGGRVPLQKLLHTGQQFLPLGSRAPRQHPRSTRARHGRRSVSSTCAPASHPARFPASARRCRRCRPTPRRRPDVATRTTGRPAPSNSGSPSRRPHQRSSTFSVPRPHPRTRSAPDVSLRFVLKDALNFGIPRHAPRGSCGNFPELVVERAQLVPFFSAAAHAGDRTFSKAGAVMTRPITISEAARTP